MKTVIHVGFALAVAAGMVHADSLLLVAADASGYVTGAQASLKSAGKFSAVDIFDAHSATPTLAQLSGYTDVLAWTNLFPADGTALGNVLADFYDLGGKHVTIATYALTNPGGIGGRIATGSYLALTDTGNFADPSGLLVATAPGDPVFSKVNLSTLTYFHASGFANGGLATGATLLANDGSGIYMVARSANGVVDVNLYPGLGAGSGTNENNSDLYTLLANTFSSVPAACITSLNATVTTVGKIQLAWTLAGADHYDVYRSGVSGGPYTLIGSTNSTTSSYLDGSVVSGTYYYVVREATAANVETCQSNEAHATVAGDSIPPVTTLTALPAANAKGWNKSNVTITLSATDNAGGSGVAQISIALNGAQTGSSTMPGSSASVTIATEGVTTITYFSTDNAGNAEAPKTFQVMLDKTPPSAHASPNPLPDPAGWNNTDVTVTFTGADTLSGIASCTSPVTLTSNGSQVVNGSCSDDAGNVSAPATLTVNIEKAGPVIEGAPAPGSCVLWSPDNKLVHVATLWAKNATTFDVTGTSNQAADPGKTDIMISGSGLQRDIELRAERSGNGSDRIYTLTATATNPAGISTIKTFTCTVPHDQSAEKNNDRH